MSDYKGTPLTIVPSQGGAVQGTLSSNVYQGNDGTAIGCTRVYVQGAWSNVGPVMMNIGAAATSVLGVFLPIGGIATTITVAATSVAVPGPMELPIDDVSRLYFWGQSGDHVNILYVR